MRRSRSWGLEVKIWRGPGRDPLLLVLKDGAVLLRELEQLAL